MAFRQQIQIGPESRFRSQKAYNVTTAPPGGFDTPPLTQLIQSSLLNPKPFPLISTQPPLPPITTVAVGWGFDVVQYPSRSYPRPYWKDLLLSRTIPVPIPTGEGFGLPQYPTRVYTRPYWQDLGIDNVIPTLLVSVDGFDLIQYPTRSYPRPYWQDLGLTSDGYPPIVTKAWGFDAPQYPSRAYSRPYWQDLGISNVLPPVTVTGTWGFDAIQYPSRTYPRPYWQDIGISNVLPPVTTLQPWGYAPTQLFKVPILAPVAHPFEVFPGIIIQGVPIPPIIGGEPYPWHLLEVPMGVNPDHYRRMLRELPYEDYDDNGEESDWIPESVPLPWADRKSHLRVSAPPVRFSAEPPAKPIAEDRDFKLGMNIGKVTAGFFVGFALVKAKPKS